MDKWSDGDHQSLKRPWTVCTKQYSDPSEVENLYSEPWILTCWLCSRKSWEISWTHCLRNMRSTGGHQSGFLKCVPIHLIDTGIQNLAGSSDLQGAVEKQGIAKVSQLHPLDSSWIFFFSFILQQIHLSFWSTVADQDTTRQRWTSHYERDFSL